jgi:hypothetical protein
VLPTAGTEFGLLLTPTTTERSTHPDEMRARAEAKGYRNGTKYNSLMSQILYGDMLPTPLAQEHDKITGKENQDSLTKRARQLTGKTSQLSPLFVEEMMGFPKNWTVSPFQNGEEKA